jgi:choline kinase
MGEIRHAVITMAGMGTRLGQGRPKGLIDIGGHKLAFYVLSLLKRVPDVRIVVGYQADAVAEYVRRHRPDVSLVLNKDYETTSCAYSVNLACRDLADPYLIIDGDLLLDRHSFETFVAACDDETLVGVTPAKTEEAVFVALDETSRTITAFTRRPVSRWEWSGVAYVHGFHIDGTLPYICDTLERHLPLKYHPIDCFEIDTPADYQLALANFGSLGYGSAAEERE